MRRAAEVLTRDEAALLKDIPGKNAAAGKAAIAGLRKSLQEFQVVVENKDKQEARRRCGEPGSRLPPHGHHVTRALTRRRRSDCAGAAEAAGGAGVRHAD